MPRFCTAPVDGHPCGGRTRPGHRFCFEHSPDAGRPWPRCQFLNRSGHPCRATPLRGQDHCFTHSRRNPRAKQPPVPLDHRIAGPEAAAMFPLFSSLAQSPSDPPQPVQNQWLGTVSPWRGGGGDSLHTSIPGLGSPVKCR